ncbi:ketosynthase chain-length factor [Streptomyces sp. OF3]|uniref:Ketosynthase chain-length factor n=1 Tax=Streptomyces alkaliterrae TaxID=2213162 RepID=A0A7W3WK43_9ACTN|nr:beta-ketoacyl synthase N-terminal-like domain-containing protein [Streptomyces alkaliterrae]MBB1253380.1 ketosynthase chain-length factor [Streptomyces alkaliterrae]
MSGDGRPVITGIGVVAPTGVGAGRHWENGLTGRSRIGALRSAVEPWAGPDGGPPDDSSVATAPVPGDACRRPPVRVAGQVPGFSADQVGDFVGSRVRVQTDRWTWFALAATRLAFEDAGLDPERHDPYQLSVVTASASGGNEFGQREINTLWRNGPGSVSAYQSIGWFYAASSGQISIRDQLKGSCGVFVADAAGPLDALAAAARQLRRGVGAVVTGGTEAPLSPYALACQARRPGLSDTTDPVAAYRPFAADGACHVPGEGGAMLVLEDRGFAEARGGSRRYAELAGTAATHDAGDPVEVSGDCTQYARAMRLAIDRAGLEPADVDVVFADGAGEERLDALEVAALRKVFGDRPVPVTVPATMTGRLCSGGAALSLAWAALALSHDTVPPTVPPDGPLIDPGLDLVTSPRVGGGIRTALVVARGAGGFNSAAVLSVAS